MVCSTLTNDTLTTTYGNIDEIISTRAQITNVSFANCEILNCSIIDLNYVAISNISLVNYYENVSAMNAKVFLAEMQDCIIESVSFTTGNGSFLTTDSASSTKFYAESCTVRDLVAQTKALRLHLSCF